MGVALQADWLQVGFWSAVLLLCADMCGSFVTTCLPAATLCSVIDRAPSQLDPVLAMLRQRLPADPIGLAGTAEVAYLGAAMEATSACLCLAPACGASHGVQLELAKAGIGVLMSSGLAMLRPSSPHAAQAAHTAMLTTQLRRQLALASYCMDPLTESAAAAEAAVQPQQFVTWLTATVDALMRLGEDRQTGGRSCACVCVSTQVCVCVSTHCVLMAWHTRQVVLDARLTGCDAVLVAGPDLIPLPSDAAAHFQRELLGSFAYMCHWLLMQPAWDAHAAVTKAQPHLARSMAQLCLSFVSVLAAALPLPPERRPASCTWGAVATVCQILTTSLLHTPFFPLAADTSLLSAACAGSVQLVQQLPLDRPPPSISKKQHPLLLFGLIGLLRCTCGTAAVWQRLDSRQQQRLAKQLVPVFSTLPQQLRLVVGGGHWQVAHLSGLDLSIATATVNSASCVLSAYCSYVQPQQSHSLADVVSFCGTACSVLQCLPLLQELAEANPANQPCIVPCTSLAVQALDLAVFAAHAAVVELIPPRTLAAAAAADTPQLTTALWKLHSHLAQLVHFSAAAGNPLINLELRAGTGLPVLALSNCINAAAELHFTECEGSHGPALVNKAVPR